MKNNYKYSTVISLSIIIVSLVLLNQNTIAQPGYYPGYRMLPNHSVIVPNQPQPQARQGYNPYIRRDNVQPLISFGMHFDPLLSWFSTDSYDVRNDGVVPGFNFGISYNRHFSPNYSFSTGINIINAGGRLISSETSQFELKNYNYDILTVEAGEQITYKITYLSIPLGIKLQTNQIVYGRFFTDFGFDPKIVIAGRADIPSLRIKGGNALPELNTFNLSFHAMAGMEYPLGGGSNFIFGIGFENNLFDTTRDNGDQLWDMVHQKALSFRLGITF
ncbi:MAG: PorT family protein [Bacteroidales bacterium]|nr:PorT family protein [Bacteroidales bacterium]